MSKFKEISLSLSTMLSECPNLPPIQPENYPFQANGNSFISEKVTFLSRRRLALRNATQGVVKGFYIIETHTPALTSKIEGLGHVDTLFDYFINQVRQTTQTASGQTLQITDVEVGEFFPNDLWYNFPVIVYFQAY